MTKMLKPLKTEIHFTRKVLGSLHCTCHRKGCCVLIAGRSTLKALVCFGIQERLHPGIIASVTIVSLMAIMAGIFIIRKYCFQSR